MGRPPFDANKKDRPAALPIGHNNTCGGGDKAQSGLSPLPQVRKGVAGGASAGGSAAPPGWEWRPCRNEYQALRRSLRRTQRTDLSVYSCALTRRRGFQQVSRPAVSLRRSISIPSFFCAASPWNRKVSSSITSSSVSRDGSRMKVSSIPPRVQRRCVRSALVSLAISWARAFSSLAALRRCRSALSRSCRSLSSLSLMGHASNL